jgi:hypothetical protein
MFMGKFARHWGSAAILGLCGLSSVKAAAAPPESPTAKAHLELRAPLDLRPPATVFDSQKTLAAFPSSLRRQLFGVGLSEGFEASAGRQARIPGRIEEFARRAHREGLPVARLWENKTALLSLGLNQKGKPGLWIVQKVR